MKERPNLTQFMEQLIRALKEEERFSTAHIYQSTLNALRLFCKADVIRFNQMDRSRLKQFENHLRNKGCAWNTVSTYMRTLRSTYNKAVDEGLAEEKPRLFRHVYTGVKANTKRALDAGDMNKLLKAPLSTILIAKPGKKPGMAHLNVPATRNALCGLGISAQKRPARFRYLLSPAQNGDPAHRRSTSHSHEAYSTI